jgi:hypothetical protein
MKPSEKVVLDTLRKTTLAYLSESDYAQIEKAVEQKGILNLTGTASILVKSAVQKHEGGGHDQESHGAWANGKYNTDDSEGEDESEPKNYKGKKPKISYDAEDSEGEYTDSNYDDPKWMDDMDITHPPKRK